MSRANSSNTRFPTPAPVRSDGAWLPAGQLALFAEAGTNCHRIYSSGEGWIERLGEDALISYKHAEAEARLREGLAAWATETGCAIRRIFGKFIPRQNEERVAPTLLAGEAGLPMCTVVQENGVRYGLDFEAGYSAGLFLDQRANRAYVRGLGAKRLLNTFAYTCSFSVVAALSGAQTVSIDLSKKSLDRGKENFTLNGLAAEGHQFFADDVMETLPRLARRGERFDVIILDPPTFSRGHKGRRFQVEQSFEELLSAALEVAGPDARVLLSTNCARLDRGELERTARHCLKLCRRAATFHREQALVDIPGELGAQTLWAALKG